MSDIFISILNLLKDTEVLDIPLIVWLLIPLLFTLIISFVKGKKE